jgi:hypothetical protein
VRIPKKCARTRYIEDVFLHPLGSMGHVVHSLCPGREISMHYFTCLGGPSEDPIKSEPGHVKQNLCFFAFGGIYRRHCAFWCVRGENLDAPFFMVGWPGSDHTKK